MKAYIAAGWFTEKQERARQELLSACTRAGINVYSPKDEQLYVKGGDSKKVFDENIAQILNCDFVLASTMGKDMGTLFECGFAFAHNIPIVYYYSDSAKFNLMLSESSQAVVSNVSMFTYLKSIKYCGKVLKVKYTGSLE